MRQHQRTEKNSTIKNYFLEATCIDITYFYYHFKMVRGSPSHIKVTKIFLNNSSTTPRFAGATPTLSSTLEPFCGAKFLKATLWLTLPENGAPYTVITTVSLVTICHRALLLRHYQLFPLLYIMFLWLIL